MGKTEKILLRVLSGRSDANLSFKDLCSLLETLGFSRRVRGSHFIFFRQGVEEFINLQEEKGKAKPYQVRQVRRVIVEYGLAELNDA